MRIPLDYYRILGLPIQATAEQLNQAYRDRTLQLPRREYSEAAITSRKQLLDEAYAVLSDPEQRSTYDASFLAKTYDREPGQAIAIGTSEKSQGTEAGVDPHTPSIEIQPEQLIGSLLIFQELGEYELVLKLAQPYLGSSNSINIIPGAGRLLQSRFDHRNNRGELLPRSHFGHNSTITIVDLNLRGYDVREQIAAIPDKRSPSFITRTFNSKHQHNARFQCRLEC